MRGPFGLHVYTPTVLTIPFIFRSQERSVYCSHPEEVARQLDLDVDEEDVVRRVQVAPRFDLLEARHETVARRKGVDHGDVVHKPPAPVGGWVGGWVGDAEGRPT